MIAQTIMDFLLSVAEKLGDPTFHHAVIWNWLERVYEILTSDVVPQTRIDDLTKLEAALLSPGLLDRITDQDVGESLQKCSNLVSALVSKSKRYRIKDNTQREKDAQDSTSADCKSESTTGNQEATQKLDVHSKVVGNAEAPDQATLKRKEVDNPPERSFCSSGNIDNPAKRLKAERNVHLKEAWEKLQKARAEWNTADDMYATAVLESTQEAEAELRKIEDLLQKKEEELALLEKKKEELAFLQKEKEEKPEVAEVKKGQQIQKAEETAKK